jgi:hypothetical protein
MARVIVVILANDKAEYFCDGGWTANAPNSPSGKSARLIRHQTFLAGPRRGSCLTSRAWNQAFIVP